MKILYYDCFSGISGDMNLGAMIDLGMDGTYLIKELSKLHLDSEFEIKIKKDIKNGISGTKVDVLLIHENHEHLDADENHHEDKNQHGHHHRHLEDIEKIIDASSLNENVKMLSLNMFMKIAQAEAKVHGMSIYEVMFHEVGAIDSIVDIVGAAIALDYFKADKIMASPVQVGGGFVKSAHGLIPVPVPATVEILNGIPLKSGIVPFETTTPTGAAILAANAEEFTDKMEFSIEKIGYGLGTKDFEIPNVLRVYLINTKNNTEIEQQYILETNIDDMNPEFYSYVEEQLFDRGALDVFKTPIIMKKGRPAIKLSILVNQAKEKDILDVIFKETTSIGIRKFKVEKIMLNREFSKICTKYGEVTIKKSYYEDEEVKYKAEYEDCKRLAKENNIPIAMIYQEVNKEMDKNA